MAGKTSYPDTAGNVRPTIANVRNPRRIVMRGDEYDPVAMADHIRAAKEAGHDALLIKGMRDDFEGTGEKGDVLVVFDEGNLRSAFDRRPFSETEAAATGNTIPLNVDKVNAPEVQRAIHAGRELDAKLNELPTGAAWVDSPSERAAVMGHQTEALRDVVEADGAFGPILRQFQGRPKEAIEELRRLQSGDAIGALHHPHTGPVDLVWGEPGTGDRGGFGLAKIERKHPEVVPDLDSRLASATEILSESPNRVRVTNGQDIFVISKNHKDNPKTWLLTGFEATTDEAKQRIADRSMGRANGSPEGSSPSAPLRDQNNTSARANQEGPEEAEMRRAMDDAERNAPTVDMGDGKGARPISSVLDELDADDDFAAVIDLCGKGRVKNGEA